MFYVCQERKAKQDRETESKVRAAVADVVKAKDHEIASWKEKAEAKASVVVLLLLSVSLMLSRFRTLATLTYRS